jgi:hypothetical protein
MWFTSFPVGLLEAACSTPLLLVNSLSGRSRLLGEARHEIGDFPIPVLEDGTTEELVALALQLDEAHVVFPSSLPAL